MLCPKCFTDNNCCSDSRPSEEFIYRRRKCKECGFSWLTVEMDLDRAGEEYQYGDGYENNSKKLNELLHLTKNSR